MKVDQIAVFLENKSGRLAAITNALSDNNINIRALSVADTADFGILRLIVDETDKATRVLKEEGFIEDFESYEENQKNYSKVHLKKH